MSKVRLFFAGDFCSKPTTSFITVSDDLKQLIQSCDLRVVNFEVPLKPENVSLPPQQYERFFQHDDVPQFLRNMGFNLFSIANNHLLDWGEKGYEKTVAALGEDCFGAGTYDEAYKVKKVEVGGIKIGFMALSYAAYKGVFDNVSRHDGVGCAYINDLKVNHVILEAKKELDYLFILPHDGIEYIDIPLPETIARYRDFIDYGADGVIGCHPHCPQGWEEYKGKPIFYSLGNFFFNSKKDTLYRAWNRPHWYEGMCVVLEIEDGQLVYTIVNTRNTDNVSLSIDTDVSRDEHNQHLQEYLRDKGKYDAYLNEVALSQNYVDIIDRSFHPRTLRRSTKKLFKLWMMKLRKKDFTDDFALKTLLRNDTRRSLMMRTLK
ncbi:MAG: CapA family protein [Bacteroidales bacterium]|nr:CapA family protein [Bacteroidales bacterium]